MAGNSSPTMTRTAITIALSFTSLLIQTTSAQQLPLNIAFDIRPAATVVGGCTDAQIGILNSMWDDSWTLVTNAITLTQACLPGNAGSGFEQLQAQCFFWDCFGQKERADYNDALEWFTDVRNFMMNGVGVSEVGMGQRPRLYCDSAWTVLQPLGWDTPAMDKNGDPLNSPNGQRLTIRSSGLYDEFFNKNPQPVPYWATDFGDYFFEPAYPGGSYCGAGNLAGTTDTPSFTITICPNALQVGQTTGHYQTLADASANLQLGQHVQQYSTLSLTLFHELFHLVEGAGERTQDFENAQGESSGWRVINELAEQTALDIAAGVPHAGQAASSNPESFTYFALDAYFYYTNRISFIAGTARNRDV